MTKKNRIAAAVGAVFAVVSGSATSAVTMYSDNFSTAAPAIANGYNPVTSFTTTSGGYSAKGANGYAGNVDIVAAGYSENLCAAGATACIDLDGTNIGQVRADDYMWTQEAFTFNATDQYRITVNANATTRNQQSPFIFGLLSATDENFPLTYGSSPHSYATVGAGGQNPLALLSGFQNYEYTFKLADLGINASTTARLFFQNYTNQVASDNVGAILQNITLQNLTAVPLPAAAWLLLSGLAGVGLFARRRSQPAPAAAI